MRRLSRARGGVLLALAFWAVALSLASVPAAGGESLLAGQEARATLEWLPGEWTASLGTSGMALTLTADGQFVLDGRDGQYVTQDNTLRLLYGGREATYQFAVTRDTLTISGGDLAAPVEFTRKPDPAAFINKLLRTSPEAARLKAYRILAVLLTALVCRIGIALLRALSSLVVLSEWGPLKLFYRVHKSRALTLHSVVLNLLKYVIYLTAVGVILAELGVNYTAYLASLSVVGLAIGFGSQGLVQDMVTGFFVIFEGQFDVGDMVDVSGQTGVVEALGLRTTKLRNYLGQTVLIPNRNISVVGNYTAGGQQVTIDVAAADAGEAERAAPVVEEVAAQTAQQFPGIMLAEPQLVGPIPLGTGEHFVRIQALVWPGQQWVVEGQLVPRLREVLKARGHAVPGDRVVVFYHTADERRAWNLRNALEGLTKRFWRPGGNAG
jgi:small conductance mechanosensitive channel